ncbi:DUF7003 family protein [Actinoplanes couchii]|uniref:Uncharacterized protein n=1 Tax=Actinoplanes couchii TaxID=403638 RepID=A0ABQ3XR43_9ACTN|nr:hypothetical protein [Actinoplanes couchii]GID60991.1 hypothetical protein Aco03nite_093950 [Actinoplanes couchii]
MEPSAILDQLDAVRFFPEPGDVRSYQVAERLHAFSDGQTRWALIIEFAGYNPRASNLVDQLRIFGNCVTADDWQLIRRIENVEEAFDREEWPLQYQGAPLRIRGRLITPEPGGPCRPEEVMRQVPRDLLLADEQELRRWVPADLPEVLRLDEWHHTPLWPYRDKSADRAAIRAFLGWSDDVHPDLPPARSEGVAVSDIETYRQVADVLATGDSSRYRPALPPNTHWRNWPATGSI